MFPIQFFNFTSHRFVINCTQRVGLVWVRNVHTVYIEEIKCKREFYLHHLYLEEFFLGGGVHLGRYKQLAKRNFLRTTL